MIFSKIIFLLAVYTKLSHAAVARNHGGFNSTSSDTAAAAAASTTANANDANAANSNTNSASASVNAGSSLTLDANAVQTGSQSNGLQSAEAGQAASATDNANFINFCAGKTLTNGQQLAGGSCNGIVMGDIPSSSNMISSIITNPGPGDTIAANQDFTVNVQVANLVAGSFTNPNTTYYAAPQALEGGKVVGHTHITIQSLGSSLAATTPPDASTFAFFKGVDDAGNGNGGLNATVAGGLPAGAYRVCTMTSASNHQPVTMPLAQRGAQDDCNKFTVTDGGSSTGSTGSTGDAGSTGNTGNGNANSNNTTSSAASDNGNSGSSTSSAAGAASTVSSSASSTNSNAASGNAGGNRNGGGGRNGGGRNSFVLREFIA